MAESVLADDPAPPIVDEDEEDEAAAANDTAPRRGRHDDHPAPAASNGGEENGEPAASNEDTNDLLDRWTEAKRQKNFAKSDALREQLRARGIEPDAARPSQKQLAATASSGGGRPPPPPHMDTETEAKLDQWVNAKRAKDFATADRLREEMCAAGVEPDMVRPAVTSPSRPACRFYRSGTCSRGAGCLFSHAEPADAPRRARSPSISPPRRREPPRDLPPRGDGSSSRFVRDYERDEPPRRGDYATWRHERREEPPRERRRRSRSRSPDREARRRRYGSRSPERDTSRRRYDY